MIVVEYPNGRIEEFETVDGALRAALHTSHIRKGEVSKGDLIRAIRALDSGKPHRIQNTQFLPIDT